MKNEKTTPFVAIRRDLREHYLAMGKINYSEFCLLCTLYILSNPVNGQATVSLEQLTIETPYKRDYIRKMLRSLVSHKLIYYKPRKGKNGIFIIWIDKYIKSKGVNDIEIIKNQKENITSVIDGAQTNSQAETKVNPQVHNFKEEKNASNAMKSTSTEGMLFTSTHNDNKNYNKYSGEEKNKKGLEQLRDYMKRNDIKINENQNKIKLYDKI
jgi:hypothetical protein